jgi:hypothetical protein
MIDEATQRLLERLQTGWQPTRDEIPAKVPQHHLERWRFTQKRDLGHGLPKKNDLGPE